MRRKPALFETLVQTDEGGEGPCEARGQEVDGKCQSVDAETQRPQPVTSCQISDICFSLGRGLGHTNILNTRFLG